LNASQSVSHRVLGFIIMAIHPRGLTDINQISVCHHNLFTCPP
jgi:hypothetical protein